ncbi:MAG: hypothetical protein FWH26_11115 [Oscillospiraceae bacterium]|nr:hypothetical protein [Oscillospiraceae bacterium]
MEKVSSSYTGGADEVLDYSEAEYKVNVYVQQCLDDECADYLEYYVSAIGAVKLTLDDGDPGDDALKLDPTPGSLRVDSELSEMEFTNSYVKRTVPDPNEDDPTTLTISKLTTGAYRDETEYFDFVLTLALPVVGGIDLAEEGFDGPFEVKVFEDGVDVTEDHPDATLDEIEFIAGSNNFQLKHGQSLKIYGLAYGTTYTISEIDPTNYTPSALITRGGAVGSASGGALSTTKTMPDQLVAGGGANSAAYTNARNDITLEGLNINDIPFIGMIALALAAGLFLVAAKTRKAKKSYNH